MTLREFLNYFDFDYEVYNDKPYDYPNGYISLIDLQGANLGNIESEKYSNDKQGVNSIIDRLDTYYQDYIFTGIEEVLEEEYGIDTENMNWKDLYNKVIEMKLNYGMDVMPYIFGEKELVLE